jgi:hypothetical protein
MMETPSKLMPNTPPKKNTTVNMGPKIQWEVKTQQKTQVVENRVETTRTAFRKSIIGTP